MIAILSDIHGNLEALDAVLADVKQRGVAAIYCLGDTTGYGPDSVECLRRIRDSAVVLRGNHDEAVVTGEPDGFSESARRSVLFARSQFSTAPDGRRLLAELAGRSPIVRDNFAVYVHGSPRNPLYEYLFPEDVYNKAKLFTIGNRFETICFCGHTHVPGIFVQSNPADWTYLTTEDCSGTYTFGSQKTICNVGSVGQPRDLDWRACYVLWDGQKVEFRRVEYDVNRTVAKIHAIPELDTFTGDRLLEGR